MPLEIIYKEPTDRPIERINFVEDDGSSLYIRRFTNVIHIEAREKDLAVIELTFAEFKEFAAAIYKFSQEV